MRPRIIKGNKYRLYPTGDIWRGERMFSRIESDEVLDFMMQNKFSKKTLDVLLEGGEDVMKDEMERQSKLGLTIEETRDKMGFKDPAPVSLCRHNFLFVEKILNCKYVMVCRYCLFKEII